MIKKIVTTLISVVGIMIIIAFAIFSFLMIGQSKVREQEINAVQIADKADGTYKGKFKSFRWTTEVEVVVKDGKIVEIKILDDVLIPREDVSESIINQVIEKQSLDVDIISGATITSKAYLKAIEEALNKE